jgi:hypothetical protein
METDPRISDSLGGLLARIDEARCHLRQVVILGIGPYYSRMLFNAEVAYAEVISNYYLLDDDRITPQQELVLLDQGWLPPGATCHHACRLPHPNFHRSWRRPTPSADLAAALMRGLHTVWGESGQLSLSVVWRERPGDPSLGPPTAH